MIDWYARLAVRDLRFKRPRNLCGSGIVQYNEEKSVEWWASTFCKKKRGATLYRLRDDIIFNPETAEKE